MLDIKLIISDVENVKSKCIARGLNIDFDALIKLDADRRKLTTDIEVLQSKRNELSKEVGRLKQSGSDTTSIQEEVKKISENFATLEKSLKNIQLELDAQLHVIPNLVDDTTPIGKDENDNTLVRTWGTPKEFDFAPKSHADIGTDLNMVDFERGVKTSGSRFAVLTGTGAKLERALISFMLDTHITDGRDEVMTPFLVNSKSMFNTGQLPKFSEEAFTCEKDDLFLIPTSEVSVTNLYSSEVIPTATLPIKHVAYSACFRREAGSYGKDVKGLIRLHQFNKVELVTICRKEDSEVELENILTSAEKILQLLEIPYRIMLLSSGDIGFTSSKTYDIEVWLPSENCYREISSCSNCKDFQARRGSIRYKDENGKMQFAHTLNGSGLAVGRTLVAILENYQNVDGSVTIPKILRPYFNNMEKIEVPK